jgi:predicted XRE-type DNA-binding protein
MITSKFESVWDALIDNPDDLKKKSDYLILIQARLHGLSGKVEDKAESLGLTLKQVQGLMKGDAQNFSLTELVAVARKAGISVRLRLPK